MIIDVHGHLGYDVAFDLDNDEELLISSYQEYGVDGAVVQPFIPRPYVEEYKAIHDRIYRLTQRKEKKFWGMASMNPHFRPEEYAEETKRCVKELGFVAAKMTPIGHAVNPASKDGMTCCDIVRQLGVPLMIHTGNGGSFADPIQVAKCAEAFPDLVIVMAHAGSGGGSINTATYIAKTHDNVYLEPSWVDIASVMGMIREVGCSKLMFSSDVAENIPVELAKYRRAISNTSDLERVLSGTAIEVFGLK